MGAQAVSLLGHTAAMVHRRVGLECSSILIPTLGVSVILPSLPPPEDQGPSLKKCDDSKQLYFLFLARQVFKGGKRETLSPSESQLGEGAEITDIQKEDSRCHRHSVYVLPPKFIRGDLNPNVKVLGGYGR